MVRVYRFRVFDPKEQEWVVQLSKATGDRIEEVGGRIMEGTAEDVSATLIDEEGYYRLPPS
jgi:hypothetical protein